MVNVLPPAECAIPAFSAEVIRAGQLKRVEVVHRDNLVVL
jgi:hypothetical protein